MRVFYVLYVKDPIVNDCLEAIRFLSDPHQKSPAHVTVRGPYRTRITTMKLDSRIAGNTVVINNAGNFFEAGQNTVFFECFSPRLREIWKKPDHGFAPHITIYDGPSATFARKLYSVVAKYKYNVTFKATTLQPYVSVANQRSFRLAMGFNTDFVSEIVGEDPKELMVTRRSTKERLSMVERICKFLSGQSLHKRHRQRSFVFDSMRRSENQQRHAS